MLKSIGIVTDRKDSSLDMTLKNNLEMIFSGFVKVSCYCLYDLQDEDKITDDVVLVMVKRKTLEIRKRVADMRRIIVVQRTVRESEIYQLFSIPPKSKLLVVNDNRETTMELVTLFYQIGVNHLEFIAYEEGQDYSDIRIAITPNEKSFVPNYISTVIDLGHRVIDIATFIAIINKLDLRQPEISRRLIKYSEDIVVMDTGLKQQYKELITQNSRMDAVLNLSREGILLVDNEDRVCLYNSSLAKMFDICEDITNKDVADIFSPEILKIIRQEDCTDEIVEYDGRSLLVNKCMVKLLGEKAGVHYNFQEVTYIKQLEHNLSEKLQTKGLVAHYNFSDIKTQSPRMIKCIEFAKEVAASDLTVLITGESGTGKELIAQSIHNASQRSKQPFVAFNCAAVPESIIESELFGYEGGAFTGALKEGKVGLFEQANNGTVFLDEIADMPYMLQAKLLRVLQERQVMRVGSQRIININIRVIAATNQDLQKRIRDNQFREDLYYRLNVLPIVIPALRERTEDVFYLLNDFIQQSSRKKLTFSEEACAVLQQYKWPGNIRELTNVAAYISFLDKGTVSIENLPGYVFNSLESFSWEEKVMESRLDREKAVAILRAIYELDFVNKRAGRKSIDEVLANKGERLPEGEVRKGLTVLNEIRFIKSGTGRRGSEITAKGKAFMKWLENRR